jgi:pimeloyl-ACP methyl ester carboxylesterase
MKLTTIGAAGKPNVVFAHGWARTYRDFIPVAESLEPIARSVLIDLPGFGATPAPSAAWGTKEYADQLHSVLAAKLKEPYIWVGHSFGGRIGLRMAVQYPQALSGLVLIASAGIPRTRSEMDIFKGNMRQKLFKFKKSRAKDADELDALERQYGSLDYIHSAEIGMRDVFLATINEDQTESAKTITTPTQLIYGARDTETPPEIGQRLAKLIPDAVYTECPGLDHISVLSRGRQQIARTIKDMLA